MRDAAQGRDSMSSIILRQEGGEISWSGPELKAAARSSHTKYLLYLHTMGLVRLVRWRGLLQY